MDDNACMTLEDNVCLKFKIRFNAIWRLTSSNYNNSHTNNETAYNKHSNFHD